MIRYTLKCSEDHSFESWFKSASAFETLQSAGQLSCPHCGSEQVSKSLMAPPVSTARKKEAAPQVEQDADAAADTAPSAPNTASAPAADTTNLPAPVNAQDPSAQSPDAPDAEAALAAIRNHVENNSDYVGTEFTKEARAMNDGKAPARSIYGEAKAEDAKALIEEGVPIMPLPFLPKRKLN